MLRYSGTKGLPHLHVLSLFPYGMSGGFDPPSPETVRNLKLIKTKQQKKKQFQVHVDVPNCFCYFVTDSEAADWSEIKSHCSSFRDELNYKAFRFCYEHLY